MLNLASKIKKLISTALLAVVLFWAVFGATAPGAEASARKCPGDQYPAENYQIGEKSDILTQKKIEAVMYPLNLVFLGLAAAAPFAGGGMSVVVQRVFADMMAAYGANASAAGNPDLGSGAAAMKWLNYPPSAFSFQCAKKDSGIRVVSGAITNITNSVFDWIANLIFFVSKAATLLGNNIVVLCFDSQWLRNGADWISENVKNVSAGFSDSNGWLFTLFALALCALAVNTAVHLFRARVVNAVTAVFVAAACLGGFYLYAANANYLVRAASEFTDGVAGLTMSAASVLSPQTEDALSALSPLRKGVVTVTNLAWCCNVAKPWSVGQFGTADVDNLRLTDSEWEGGKRSAGVKDSVPSDYSDVPPPSAGKRLTKGDLERMVRGDDLYIDTLYLGADDEFRDDLVKVLSAEDIDHGRHKETIFTCGEETASATHHIYAAFLSLIPSLSYFALAVAVGLPVIFAQIALLVMLVFLPAVLVMGVAGDSGRDMVLKCARLLLGFFAAKIVNGFFLGTVLFFAALLSQAFFA